MNAMILAAGLGTRLRPFSSLRPKPLFPVLNRPLLLLTINRLRSCGFKQITVNTHHLGDQIGAGLRHEPGITLQAEEKILGTGGGLRRALAGFAADQPVLVVNGDIYHSLDYAAIYRRHLANGCPVTMVLHDHPRFNNVAVDEKSCIRSFGAQDNGRKDEKKLAFTGIQVINPEVLQTIAPDKFSCILDCYRQWLRLGKTIEGLTVRHHFWTDMGTAEDYLELNGGLLTGRIPPYPEIKDRTTEKFLISGAAYLAKGVKLYDWVCIGPRARIGKGAELKRVVVWDNAQIPAGSKIQDTIVI